MRCTKKCSVAFPDWALSYFVNGDDSGVSPGERKMVDEWWEGMTSAGYTDYELTEDHNEFNSSPEFGLPCSTTTLVVLRLAGKQSRPSYRELK